jgi:large subunit ribosomal protein L25
MKQFKLSATSRSALGTRASGRLRKSGFVPAVIYGKKSEARSLAFEESALRTVMRQVGSSVAMIEVNEDGKETLALLQEVKRHPFRDHLMHVDLHQISPDEPLHVHVPVHILGTCPGVVNGNGSLNVVLHSIDVKALPRDFPSSIDVDVSNLQVGQSIHIKELLALKGVTYLAPEDQVVVACNEPLVQEIAPVVEAAPADVKGKKPAKGKK